MLLGWRLGREEIVRPRRQGPALLCGPSASPLEDATRLISRVMKLSDRSQRPFARRIRVRAIAGGTHELVASGAFGLRPGSAARTVASMRASSNNRWRERAAGRVRLADTSTIWIKCLRLALQRPRVPQLHR